MSGILKLLRLVTSLRAASRILLTSRFLILYRNTPSGLRILSAAILMTDGKWTTEENSDAFTPTTFRLAQCANI
jgi:hypothetical protein